MRQAAVYSLVTSVHFFNHAAAGSLPRGVGPEFAKFYELKDTFACISNPEIELSSKRVNDNSCDCPDGSDEPGTSACAKLDPQSPAQPLIGTLSGSTNTTNALPGFWCANAGHIGSYVPFMFVNDGVCDYELCCDGSEEYTGVGGIKCENRCDTIGKEWRRVEEERNKRIERAVKKRKTMAKESRQLRKQVIARIASLKLEVASLEAEKAKMQARYDDVLKEESGRVVKDPGQGGKLGILLSLAKNRVQQLREALEKVVSQRDQAKTKLQELEDILRKFREEYNPNFNDEGVKQAVKAWDDYAAKLADEPPADYVGDISITEAMQEDSEQSGVNWKEFEEEEPTDTDILYMLEEYLPYSMRTFVKDKLKVLRVWLIENGILADNPKSGAESHLAKAAREALESATNDLMLKQNNLEAEETDLEKDYGEDDIFRALKDKCISKDVAEYEYELCWFGQTSQKTKGGYGGTSMGTFEKIDREMSDEEEPVDGRGLGAGQRIVLRYDNGQGCWNGPHRRTDVWLACSETDEIWKVTEAEKCVYKMEVGTPIACESVMEPPHGKDEL